MSDLRYMLEAKASMLYDRMCYYKENWKPEYEKLYEETDRLLEETLNRLKGAITE